MKHSESIPTKKFFDQNFLTLSFFTILGLLAKNDRVRAKKITGEKNFDFEIFDLKYVLKDSESIPGKKNSTKNFWLCHFFTIFGPKNHVFRGFWGQKFLSKKHSLTKKNYTWKKFWFRAAWFIIRFETFWIDSIQKNVRPNIFWLRHFVTILAILAEKRQSLSKKKLHRKNFPFRDFRFKIRFDTFWIDSDQKKLFRPNFFDFVIFLLFWPFWPKNDSIPEKILHGNIFSRFLV